MYLLLHIIACDGSQNEKNSSIDVSKLRKKSYDLGWTFHIDGPPYNTTQLEVYEGLLEKAESLNLHPQEKIFGKITPNNVLIYDQLFNVVLIKKGETYVGEGEKRHKIKIRNDLYVMKEELLQITYEKFTNKNPSTMKDLTSAVSNIQWLDAVKFANIISERSGLQPCYQIKSEQVRWTHNSNCNGWRLPTEVEWDYVATSTKDNPDMENMSGGVAEWTWDWFRRPENEEEQKHRFQMQHKKSTCQEKCCNIEYNVDSVPDESFDLVGVRYFRSIF